MKYKILFIDEEKDQHDNFLDYMDKIEDKVEVKCLYPEENIEAMIQVFEDEHPDAIVTDHQLNEIKTEIQYNVSYNGAELVNAYRDIRPNFPCFVITSYDKYKKSIDEAQSELTSLVQKKQDKGLTLHEEDRLVELDSFLEKSLDSYATLPADIKRSKSLEQLSEVIDKVDEILAKLD